MRYRKPAKFVTEPPAQASHNVRQDIHSVRPQAKGRVFAVAPAEEPPSCETAAGRPCRYGGCRDLRAACCTRRLSGSALSTLARAHAVRAGQASADLCGAAENREVSREPPSAARERRATATPRTSRKPVERRVELRCRESQRRRSPRSKRRGRLRRRLSFR